MAIIKNAKNPKILKTLSDSGVSIKSNPFAKSSRTDSSTKKSGIYKLYFELRDWTANSKEKILLQSAHGFASQILRFRLDFRKIFSLLFVKQEFHNSKNYNEISNGFIGALKKFL